MAAACTTDQLRAGSLIEVLWKLEGRGKPREVWWNARVRQTCFRGRSPAHGVRGTATIEYEACFGFEASSEKVLLLDDQRLVSKRSGPKQSRTHIWRLSHDHSSESCGTDLRMVVGRTVIQSSAVTRSADSHGTFQGFESASEDRRYTELVRRLSILERAVGGTSFSALPCQRGCAERPLGFIAVKLRESLESPIAVRTVLRGRETQLNTVQKDCVQTEADCTLREFSCIAKLVKERFPGAAQFFPSYRHTQEPAMNTTRFDILFESFYVLAEAVGVSRSGASQTIVKQKVDRRNEAAYALRVLGVLCTRKGDARVNPSEVLTVGHSAIAHLGPNQMIPIVCRQTNEWDSIDKQYVHALEAKHVNSSDFLRLICNDTPLRSSNESMSEERDTGPLAFAFKWVRTSTHGNTGGFVESRFEEVHGCLQVTLPYALYRGKAAFTEASKIITEEFICSSVF
jgi:hypothetical protein